ncbi:MAG: DUF924 domain-containing protein [Desulfuromonadales bacterium]
MPGKRSEEILEFWFGEEGGSGSPSSERTRLWFGGEPETDRMIRGRFGIDLKRARRGDYDHWRETSRGALALILILDQFARNIHRGSSLAYAADDKCQRLCLVGMELGQDRPLTILERAFFYLPLEHAEDRELQRLSVQAFTNLLEQAPAALEKTCRGFLDYAVRHREIIDRFGRFPHRNVALGRPSTSEEVAFLREPNSSF